MSLFLRRLQRAARALVVFASLGVAAVTLPKCAKSTCEFTSDCDKGRCIDGDCKLDCQAAIDCPSGGKCVDGRCEGGDVDGGLDAVGVDSGSASDSVSATDSGIGLDTASTTDTATTVDTTPVEGGGTKAYLDGCAPDGECASGHCTPGAPRFCTRSCTSDGDCADGQICAGSVCRLDDSGTRGCDTTSGAPCLAGCIGTPTSSHCTHTCSSAADCPAGFSCSPVGGKKACVEIERPCATANECASGVGFCGSGGLGCTASCSSAADCPLRIVGLPPYTCEVRTIGTSTLQVCIPPSDVLGSDPIGASCPATGTNTCRSGACDTGVSPPMCDERCTPRGECPPGYACFPDASGGTAADFICTVSGTGWLGDTCSRARDCYTGLCDTTHTCVRLCEDGLCPTGMTCRDTGVSSSDGIAIKLCGK